MSQARPWAHVALTIGSARSRGGPPEPQPVVLLGHPDLVRRPFFQEGVGLFRCDRPCEGIFYTRRVGRAPQLRRDQRDPHTTTIVAATKITGRVGRGLSPRIVDALTQREVGADGLTLEHAPTTW